MREGGHLRRRRCGLAWLAERETGLADSSGGIFEVLSYVISGVKIALLKLTEVTQADWEAWMGNNPSQKSPGCADCPVENVNWYEALAYCNALSAAEGLPECYTLTGCGGDVPDPQQY